MLRRQFFVPMLMVLCLALAGCAAGHGGTEPHSIDPTLDVCPVCMMSIVDMHFAAQLIDDRGQPVSFDDIGCMALYVKRLGPQWESSVRAVYVKDFHTMEWVPAKEAAYVQGRIDTPMSFGIVAFANIEGAQKFAASTGSRVITWEEVLVAKQTVGFDECGQEQCSIQEAYQAESEGEGKQAGQ